METRRVSNFMLFAGCLLLFQNVLLLPVLADDELFQSTLSPSTPPPTDAAALTSSNSSFSVEMICESTSMTAVVRVDGPFAGRLFAMSHSQQCYSTAIADTADGRKVIALQMPLHGGHCGTRNLGNGTFINSLVVQHHPYVLRSTDRRIEVACDYQEVRRKLRGGKQVMEGDMLTLTQVITGLAPAPPIKLRVVNSSGEEVRGVELGDSLYLKVEMLDETVFGIFGSELVARSGDGSESVMLIDDNGCPVEPGVFPALNRAGEESKSLVAPFQAFRFASDAAVKFQLTVSFCLDTCQPVTCDFNDTQPAMPERALRTSFGRRRRRKRETFVSSSGESALEEFQAGDIVTDVTMETSVFVVSNLKELRDQRWDALNGINNNNSQDTRRSPVDPFEFTSAIHLGLGGICFSPFIFYGAVLVGCVAQTTILGLCLWVLVMGRNSRRISSSSSSYKHKSSRASISSKTGLYDS